MKVKVDQEKCIGCGACIGIADEVFQFDDDGLSYAVDEEVSDSNESLAEMAAQACPTEAIEIEK